MAGKIPGCSGAGRLLSRARERGKGQNQDYDIPMMSKITTAAHYHYSGNGDPHNPARRFFFVVRQECPALQLYNKTGDN
jgi:hypothetical protein